MMKMAEVAPDGPVVSDGMVSQVCVLPALWWFHTNLLAVEVEVGALGFVFAHDCWRDGAACLGWSTRTSSWIHEVV